MFINGFGNTPSIAANIKHTPGNHGLVLDVHIHFGSHVGVFNTKNRTTLSMISDVSIDNL